MLVFSTGYYDDYIRSLEVAPVSQSLLVFFLGGKIIQLLLPPPQGEREFLTLTD